jgi:hypothetical protein
MNNSSTVVEPLLTPTPSRTFVPMSNEPPRVPKKPLRRLSLDPDAIAHLRRRTEELNGHLNLVGSGENQSSQNTSSISNTLHDLPMQ